MRRRMLSGWMRVTAVVAALVTGTTALLQAPANGNLIHEATERRKLHPISELPAGRTDKLTAAQWKIVDAKRAKEEQAKRKKMRLLTNKEMKKSLGRGPYRNAGFNGILPWQRSLRDVNLCNGNLFRSFTDIQTSPARGAGLALQRTYNSNDDRVGPFGVGWTHAYDIRMEEDPSNTPSDDSLNFADRTDFFGAKHKYHRDADGLYSPPAYLYDEMSSDYDHFLTDGPQNVLADTDKDMDGTVKHYTQIGNERLCDSITDRYGNATLLTYNTVSIGGVNKGLLDTVTDPSGRQLTFQWKNYNAVDPAHPAYRIKQVDGPQYSVAYSYNADFNLSAATLDAGDSSHLNRATTYEYTAFSGANGTETGLLSKITDPLNHSVDYTYFLPSVTNTLWVKTASEPGSPGTPLVWTFNASVSFGSIPISVIADDNNADIEVRTAVDTQLRRAFHSLRYGYLYQTTYDSANNVTVLTNHPDTWLPGQYIAIQNSTSEFMTYGPHGNVLTDSAYSDPTKPKVTTTYYNASQYFQQKSVTDRNGHTTTIIVGTNQGADPTGQLPSSNGNRGSILYTQDAGYSVSSSPSYHKQFAFQYNCYGQKVQETNPNGIVTLYYYNNQWGYPSQVIQDPHVANSDSHLARTTSTVFDIAGHTLSSTDPNGQVSSSAYNVLGQVTSAITPATGASSSETVTYAYDAGGRTISVTDNRGVTSTTYEDGNDRIASITDPVTGTTSYTYGQTGERTTMTLPGGGTWNYVYSQTLNMLAKDDSNSVVRMPTRVIDDQGRAADYWLDESGRPYLVWSNEVFDSNQNLINYMQTAYVYDNSSGNNSAVWLTAVANTWNSKNTQGQWQQSTLVQNSYTYDNAGQRLTNQITSSGTSRTEQYAYDEVNRLTSVNYDDGQTQSYSFDAMGNRLSKQDSVTGNENYNYNAANMLMIRGVNSYTYDANGNTLTGGGRTNTWDSQNRLIQCSSGANNNSFVYGTDGLRRQSTVNGVTKDFVLDHNTFIRERNHTNGASIATYLAGVRGPEYRRDDIIGHVRWYIYDGLGSVLGEVDPNGNVTSSRKYDVYGLVRGGNNPAGTSNHKFVGQLGHPSEDSSGLIYMRARYYDPSSGRFMSQDPGCQGANWYSYCGNNPINFTDETGRSFMSVLAKVWIAIFTWICGVDTGTAWVLELMSAIFEQAKSVIFQSLWSMSQLGKPDLGDFSSIGPYIKYNAMIVASAAGATALIGALFAAYTLAILIDLICVDQGVDAVAPKLGLE